MNEPIVPKNMDETQADCSRSQVADAVPTEHTTDTIRLLKKRHENRENGHIDALVVVAEWATRDEYNIVDNRLLLAANVRDHSEKAVQLEGGFAVDTNKLDEWKYINNVVSPIDGEYDTDYLPKSAVKMILQPSDDVVE